MQTAEQFPDHLPAIAAPVGLDFNAGYYAARMGRPLNPCAPVEWQNGWYAYGSEQLTTEQLQQGQEAGDRG